MIACIGTREKLRKKGQYAIACEFIKDAELILAINFGPFTQQPFARVPQSGILRR